MELKDGLEEIFNNTDITPKHLQDEKIGPLIFESYRKLISGKSTTDAYLLLSTNYSGSPFRDFESYLGVLVGPDEDDTEILRKH